jgi:hypothetical protein
MANNRNRKRPAPVQQQAGNVQAATPPAATPAPVQPVALSAAPCAAHNATQPPVQLGKYAKPAAQLGVGHMGAAGTATFTLGAWPRSASAPQAPAAGVTPSKATVPQALWLAAKAAGATASKAVSGLAIGKAALQPGTPANGALLTSAAAQRRVKGMQYAGGGQACGLWLAGYIGPHKSAACIATGALKAANA